MTREAPDRAPDQAPSRTASPPKKPYRFERRERAEPDPEPLDEVAPPPPDRDDEPA